MTLFNDFSLQDLTHALSSSVPIWGGGCGFSHKISLDYKDWKTKTGFRTQELNLRAGVGTHMDAPSHCIPNGKSIDQIPLEQLISQCVVINLSQRSHENLEITTQDILHFEKEYGKIAKNSFVIFHTGWERRWNTPDRYINNYIFPYVSREAGELLLERDVAGIGIDTLSPDRGDGEFPVHAALLGNGKYIVENVANAGLLPPTGSYSFAMPLFFEGGTEAPIRLVALVPKTKKPLLKTDRL
jgi:kynurenine formamidase